jgi:hypothetical protein
VKRIRKFLYDRTKALALALLNDADIREDWEQTAVKIAEKVTAVSERAITDLAATSEKTVADLAATHGRSAHEVLEKTCVDLTAKSHQTLEYELLKSRQRVEALRAELHRAVADFRFISSTGHHSEYADRRSKEILIQLESHL